MISGGALSVPYVLAACQCRPKFVCRFCAAFLGSPTVTNRCGCGARLRRRASLRSGWCLECRLAPRRLVQVSGKLGFKGFRVPQEPPVVTVWPTSMAEVRGR